MSACTALLGEATTSTLTLRVRAGTESLIAVYIRAEESSQVDEQQTMGAREIGEIRSEGLRRQTEQMRLGNPHDPHASARWMRLQMNDSNRIQALNKQVSEAAERGRLVRNHALRLGLRARCERLGPRSSYAGHFLACDPAHGLLWADRRLALAALAHPRCLGESLLLPLDMDCLARVMAALASLELNQRSDPALGPFVDHKLPRLLPAEERPGGGAAASQERPLRLFTASAGQHEELVSISGLQPGTAFQIYCAVWAADDPAQPAWESPVLLVSTEAAPWQRLLERAGLSALGLRLSRTPAGGDSADTSGVLGMESPADWCELLDDGERLSAVGVSGAEQRGLATLCAEQGAVTREEAARRQREARELDAKVAGLLPAAALSGLVVGDPVSVVSTWQPPPDDGGEAGACLWAGGTIGVIVGIRHAADSSSRSHPETAGGQVVETMQAQESPGPGATLITIISGSGTVDVRFGEGSGAGVITLPSDALEPRSWALFLSHAQMEAQNQCALLARLLSEARVPVWYDMDAERLEVSDMCRGIARSSFFLLYLTRSYFSRWFCRLEASVARAMGKQLIVVYESDSRHGGNSDYIALCREATDSRWPEYLPWLLGTEAIPMTRRGYAREATVGEIAKRAGIMARPRSDGGLSRVFSIARTDSDALGRSASSACSADGVGGGGEWGGELGARAIAEVEELKGVVASLQEENVMLWRALDEMRIAMGLRPQRGGSSDGGGAIVPAEGAPLDAAAAEKQITAEAGAAVASAVAEKEAAAATAADTAAHLKELAVQN
jgi:hypothetical protein